MNDTVEMKPSDLINKADPELCDRIARLFEPRTEIITLLSTLSRVMAFLAIRGAPDFESVEAIVPTLNFLFMANARIIWETEKMMAEGAESVQH